MNPINISFAPHIKAAFFDRKGGVSEGDYASLNGGLSVGDSEHNVFENRQRIAQYMGCSVDSSHGLSMLHQIHSNIVADVDFKATKIRQADSQITSQKKILLAIQTADCVPILCADPKNNIIAAIHAGWRGALDDIIAKTIEAMLQKGAQLEFIRAAIGPCIHQKSYQVDGAFRHHFIDRSKENTAFFIPSDKADYYQFNLPEYAAHCLRKIGVLNIQESLWDSCADEERFFSHRRATLRGEAATGRMISAIMLS